MPLKNGQPHKAGTFKRASKASAKSILRILPLRSRKTLVLAFLLGYLPHIAHPRTFNEKVVHRELLEHDPRFRVLADKWEVREHVADVVGKQYLTEVFAVISSVSDFDIETLPARFVAKPTHESGEIYFVSDKSALDHRDFVRTLSGWLCSTYGSFHGEYWYAQIPPRIIIEEWLCQEGHDVAPDFKFYVFHGRVEVVQVEFDRFTRHTKNLFTREWQRLPVEYIDPSDPGAGPSRPARLYEMISVAEALGQEFDFVRVDLYCIDDSRIVFGEMTFAPNSGYGRFKPRTFDYEFGKLW